MWILVSFISFLILWQGFYKRILKEDFSLRESFFYAAALWGIVVFVLTETLSLFHALLFFPLVLSWCGVLIASSYWAGLSWNQFSLSFIQRRIFQWTLTEKVFLVILICIAGLKGFSAVFSAPNTYDAMTYHLPRVEHWIQNTTVVYYPSSILRQLYSSQWAEFVVLHLRILSGADYFSNAVQWFASIGSWLGVSAIAQLLGANRRGQLLAAVFAATLPMGLVQATSTQTDYVLTFWVVTFVYFLWRTFQHLRLGYVLGASACLGLALLTKGNAYIFAPVWLFVYILASLREGKYQQRFKLLGVIVVSALIFVIPYAVRNSIVFGKPAWTHIELTNKNPTLKIVVDNLICNAALHLGAPWQWEEVNNSTKAALKGLAKLMSFDLNHPDPKPDGNAFNFQALSTGEDDSGNLFYSILMLLTVIVMMIHPALRQNRYWFYLLAIMGMIITFCVIVRFSPFNSRFQLAIFVLSTALTGTILNQWLQRRVLIIGILISLLSFPWLLSCNEHPFLGSRSILKVSRTEQYFSERPDLILPYTMTMQAVEASGCHDIGLIQGENDWEYPWWVLLKQRYGHQFRLEQVNVNPLVSSLSYPKGLFTPCLIISHDTNIILTLPQGIYVRVWFIDLPQGLTSVFLHKS